MIPGAFATILAILVLLAIVCTVIEWAIRRCNANQVSDHIRMRAGMKTAMRMGWFDKHKGEGF